MLRDIEIMDDDIIWRGLPFLLLRPPPLPLVVYPPPPFDQVDGQAEYIEAHQWAAHEAALRGCREAGWIITLLPG